MQPFLTEREQLCKIFVNRLKEEGSCAEGAGGRRMNEQIVQKQLLLLALRERHSRTTDPCGNVHVNVLSQLAV